MRVFILVSNIINIRLYPNILYLFFGILTPSGVHDTEGYIKTHICGYRRRLIIHRRSKSELVLFCWKFEQKGYHESNVSLLFTNSFIDVWKFYILFLACRIGFQKLDIFIRQIKITINQNKIKQILTKDKMFPYFRCINKNEVKKILMAMEWTSNFNKDIEL